MKFIDDENFIFICQLTTIKGQRKRYVCGWTKKKKRMKNVCVILQVSTQTTNIYIFNELFALLDIGQQLIEHNQSTCSLSISPIASLQSIWLCLQLDNWTSGKREKKIRENIEQN